MAVMGMEKSNWKRLRKHFSDQMKNWTRQCEIFAEAAWNLYVGQVYILQIAVGTCWNFNQHVLRHCFVFTGCVFSFSDTFCMNWLKMSNEPMSFCNQVFGHVGWNTNTHKQMHIIATIWWKCQAAHISLEEESAENLLHQCFAWLGARRRYSSDLKSRPAQDFPGGDIMMSMQAENQNHCELPVVSKLVFWDNMLLKSWLGVIVKIRNKCSKILKYEELRTHWGDDCLAKFCQQPPTPAWAKSSSEPALKLEDDTKTET